MSAIVRSDLRTKPCLRRAGATNYHVYLRSAASIHPDLRPWYESVNEVWNPPIVVQDTGTGFYSQFYEPKTPPDSPGYCPPVLAIRGSETNPEDFRKLGVLVTITFDFDSNVFASVVGGALGALQSYFSPFELPLGTGAGEGASKEEAVAFIRALPNSRDIARLNGTVQVRFRRPSMISPLFLEVDETITVTYTITASAHFDGYGDWGTNITQGMGEEAPQYEQAAEQGMRRAADALADWNGKLIITGHSLGGGLAACAAISGKFHHPTCDITCITYNAAGVHPASVERYVNRTASVGQNPSTKNFSVRDEILNTMQIQQNKLPFITPFIGWANRINPAQPPMSFSPARNTTMVTDGISPGSTYMGYWAPTYDPLPVLWPLSQNTVAEAQARLAAHQPTQEFVTAQEAARAAGIEGISGAQAPLVVEQERLWTEFDRVAGQDVEAAQELRRQIDDIDTQIDEQLAALDHTYETREPHFMGGGTGKFPVMTELDSMARRCNTADQFVAAFISYVVTGEMDPNRPQTVDLTTADTGAMSARIDQIVAEGGAIPPIGIASVANHTFDPCAFTFHNPRA